MSGPLFACCWLTRVIAAGRLRQGPPIDFLGAMRSIGEAVRLNAFQLSIPAQFDVSVE